MVVSWKQLTIHKTQPTGFWINEGVVLGIHTLSQGLTINEGVLLKVSTSLSKGFTIPVISDRHGWSYLFYWYTVHHSVSPPYMILLSHHYYHGYYVISCNSLVHTSLFWCMYYNVCKSFAALIKEVHDLFCCQILCDCEYAKRNKEILTQWGSGAGGSHSSNKRF